MSSTEDEYPASSPLPPEHSSPIREEPSSPGYVSSSPEPQSSPVIHSSASSESTSPAAKRLRRDYDEVPYDPMYWPSQTEGIREGNASNENIPLEAKRSPPSEGAFSDAPFYDEEAPVHPTGPASNEAAGSEADTLIPRILPAGNNGTAGDYVQDPDISGGDGNEDHNNDISDTDSIASSSGSSVSSNASTTSTVVSSRPATPLEDHDSGSDSDAGDAATSDKIYQGSDLSVDEGVLIVMNLFKNQKLEKSTIDNILQGVLKLMPRPNGMPRSKHLLFKYVTDLNTTSSPKLFHYCKDCLYFQGVNPSKCILCNCTESHHFFLLPLADQLRNFFEKHNLADIMDKYAAVREARKLDGNLHDICDGSESKNKANCRQGRYDVTFLSHTDGVSLSESSDVSFWPLEHVMFEVPPELRYRFIIVAGVWLDKCKPNMNCYLKPFVDELKSLFENGVQWTHPITKQKETSRVIAPAFCVDAPVRCQIQNILAPGGRNCCNVCEQKMLKMPREPAIPGVKRPKRKRVFNFQEEPSKLRSSERMKAQGEQAREKRRVSHNVSKDKSVKGVKGRSVVSELPQCDRSVAVFPEYMHLLLCVIRQFMTQWFLSDDPCNLKVHRDKINSFLESVKVPDFITRTPRSTDSFSKWKANELRTFLLYISVVIFSECMSEAYFQHWILLVSAMFTYLEESVSEIELVRADIMIKMFLRDYSKLYGAKHYVYYIHNLEHLGLIVRRWGPLWSNSTFPFESFNGILTQFIHGTYRQGKELVNTLRIVQGIEALKGRVEIALNSVCPSVPQTVIVQPQWELRNTARKCKVRSHQKALFSASQLQKPFFIFKRAVLRDEVFTSRIYSRQEKRNNFTVCYSNKEGQKEYGEIVLFCEDRCGQKVGLVQKFEIEHMRTFRHVTSGIVMKHIVPIKLSETEIVISLSQIKHKVIRVGDYVCLRPNTFEVNL